ncbi:MAG: hypothetical protein WCP35_16155, partial [Verrucomicrobiota bacterium]
GGNPGFSSRTSRIPDRRHLRMTRHKTATKTPIFATFLGFTLDCFTLTVREELGMFRESCKFATRSTTIDCKSIEAPKLTKLFCYFVQKKCKAEKTPFT